MEETRRVSVRVHRGGRSFKVVELAGDLDLAAARELEHELLPVADHGAVVLDVADVTFCDSCGLRSLVEAHRRARTRGASLRLAAPSTPLQRVLDLSGLTDVLEIFDDVESALKD